jgi:hypothetical protein
MKSLLPLLSLAMLAVPSAAGAQATPAHEVIARAKAEAVTIPAQAEALIRLAWFEGDAEGEVAVLAKQELVGFGEYAIPQLRAALLTIDPALQHETITAMIEGRYEAGGPAPSGYVETLLDAMWDGTTLTRRIAIPELARYRTPLALLPMIDAALDDPELMPVTIDALGVMRVDTARFFLGRQLNEGDGEIPEAAAIALARIHGRALEPLRNALQAEREVTRTAAVRALLPVATLEDLSALYEYYGAFPDDDPQLRESVREVAARLELLLQQQQELDSASPSDD